jgi:hypothetical protein
LQGDNYYEETDVVLSEPWADERYGISVVDESKYQGNFQGLVDIGMTADVEGRAFVGKFEQLSAYI